jgi:hypothetical protein
MILTAFGKSYRTCTGPCGLFLTIDKFHRAAKGPGGHKSVCKKCRQMYEQGRNKRKVAA